MALFFTLGLLLQIAIAISLSEVNTKHGTLFLHSREIGDHLKGAYQGLNGDGIIFSTTPNSLSVTTLSGEPLLDAVAATVKTQEGGSYTYDNDAIIYAEIAGSAYVEIDKRVYLATEATVAHMVNPTLRDSLLATLHWNPSHYENVDEQVHESIARLLAHPSSSLMEPAAKAMGEELGISGKDDPAVLPFYIGALGIVKMQAKSEKLNNPLTRALPFTKTKGIFPNCDLTTCPPCEEDKCMGMCGDRCNCWKFVCGDCCYQKACADHDSCCRDSGKLSWGCAMVFLRWQGCDSYECQESI